MAERSKRFINLETRQALHPYLAEEGGLEGIQPYEEDSRQFHEVMEEWQIFWQQQKNIQAFDAAGFLRFLGLEKLLTEEQYYSLLIQKAIPGKLLTRHLTERVPPEVIGAQAFLNRIAAARQSLTQIVEIAQYIEVSPSPPPQESISLKFPYVRRDAEQTIESPFYIQLLSALKKTAQALVKEAVTQAAFDERAALEHLATYLEIDLWTLLGCMPCPENATPLADKLTALLSEYVEDAEAFCKTAQEHFSGIPGIDLISGLAFAPRSWGSVTTILRENTGLTPEEFGTHLDVAGMTVRLWEQNSSSPWRENMAQNIAALAQLGRAEEYIYRNLWASQRKQPLSDLPTELETPVETTVPTVTLSPPPVMSPMPLEKRPLAPEGFLTLHGMVACIRQHDPLIRDVHVLPLWRALEDVFRVAGSERIFAENIGLLLGEHPEGGMFSVDGQAGEVFHVHGSIAPRFLRRIDAVVAEREEAMLRGSIQVPPIPQGEGGGPRKYLSITYAMYNFSQPQHSPLHEIYRQFGRAAILGDPDDDRITACGLTLYRHEESPECGWFKFEHAARYRASFFFHESVIDSLRPVVQQMLKAEGIRHALRRETSALHPAKRTYDGFFTAEEMAEEIGVNPRLVRVVFHRLRQAFQTGSPGSTHIEADGVKIYREQAAFLVYSYSALALANPTFYLHRSAANALREKFHIPLPETSPRDRAITTAQDALFFAKERLMRSIHTLTGLPQIADLERVYKIAAALHTEGSRIETYRNRKTIPPYDFIEAVCRTCQMDSWEAANLQQEWDDAQRAINNLRLARRGFSPDASAADKAGMMKLLHTARKAAQILGPEQVTVLLQEAIRQAEGKQARTNDSPSSSRPIHGGYGRSIHSASVVEPR